MTRGPRVGLFLFLSPMGLSWPDVMKQDDGKLMNVIVFEPLGEKRTRLLLYGVGYRDLPAYEDLMNFFIPANESLFRKLKDYLEK